MDSILLFEPYVLEPYVLERYVLERWEDWYEYPQKESRWHPTLLADMEERYQRELLELQHSHYTDLTDMKRLHQMRVAELQRYYAEQRVENAHK